MALELFYSYSHKDSALRDQLQTHLAQMVRNGQIEPWHDRCISAGDEWQYQIDEHIRSAQIILLLISPDFLASDYCYDVEMKVALARHAKHEAIVIPIILRPVDWAGSPFAHLQALPQDAKAITLWPNTDQAFAEVARALRDVVVRYQKPVKPAEPLTDLSDQATARPRVLDAAMPSHIVKGRATELLVLIRLPESAGLAGVLQSDEEAEAKAEDVRSKPFDVTFPFGPTGQLQPLKVTVQVTAPDFNVRDDRKNLFVPVNRDSEVCPFALTPLRTGSLLVMIELIWEDAERGYRRLKTNCVAEAELAGSPVMNLVQMEVGVAAGKRAGPSPKAAQAAEASKARSAPPRKSLASSPLVKAAAALCLLMVGGTFYVFQRGASVSSIDQASTAVPMNEVEAAQAEFQEASAHVSTHEVGKNYASPQVMLEIKAGQASLAAARTAFAAGKVAEGRKHLEAVRLASKKLKAEHAVALAH